LGESAAAGPSARRRFYFALAEAVADANEAPQWLPNSPHLPKGAN
jgi:hypothetical protein